MTAIQTLKQWFSNFKKPTQEQFWAWIDSFWHKSEKIPMDSIEGLENAIQGTASVEQLRNHLTDSQAHKELLDNKVDKVPGKKLTTEDFTTELRKKLEGLQQVDVSVLLPRGNFSGTAQDLKDLIDNLTRILQSPDTELDELQEIVAYIKQNKHILSTLGISNIAGLEDALAKKADKDHNHDEVYAPKNHTHPEHANRVHQHNWDDILRKPNNLATTQNIADAINNIQIGGRNYVLDSKTSRSRRGEYIQYKLSKTLERGKYIASVDVSIIKDTGFLGIIPAIIGKQSPYPVVSIPTQGNKRYLFEIEITGDDVNAITLYSQKQYVVSTSPSAGEATFSNFKLEKGNIATDWTPAPEDIEKQIKSLTTSQVSKEINSNSVVDKSWYGQNFNVLASCQIDLTPMENNHNISFRKCFAGPVITFQADKQIIFTSDNQFNGGDGSTAVVSTANNKIYIDIRNI